MPVRFSLLGEIEAQVDGRSIDLGPARRRCVLAALLADANRSVPTGQLVERVWGEQPPHRAHRLLASYLSRLRQALAGAGDVDIVHGQGGYVIRVAPDAIDLHRFRVVVEQARAQQALDLFDQALGLWRGDAFAGVETPWCEGMRLTLSAERLTAELDRTDIALRVGDHNAVLPEVSARAAAHPLDERMAGQLMLALYRAGRQADALEHYQRTRSRLADEFGADPGSALQELHQAILTADSVLEPRRASTIPRQLPAPPRWFVGRDRELTTLTETVDSSAGPGGAMTIVAFGGLGGVGKTSLALTWAHRNLFRFPDGQLHVNLRGFDPSGNPVPPVAAVRGFLDALGVTPAAIPADEDAQVALYRSLVAGKRLLVVLDNVRDTAQVEPLLPGSETCTVLVTSRNRLSGLGVRGALLLDLDVFDEADALKLLKHHLGARRIVGEAGAVTDVLRRCAGLPLAISILASRAAARPGFGLDVLAKELGDASARLDALEAGDLNANLRAVFSWSYQALDPDAARVLRLLGVAPGPDISMPAAAALTEFDASRVRRLLRVLVTANLLQEYLPGRYRMHDLLRLYATELACDHARQAALRRLTDFYLHTAYSAARLLRPERPSIDLSPPVTGCTPLLLADRAAATEWFSAEHACLLATLYAAVERGSHASVWKLAWTLSAFHVLRGHLRDDLAAWRAGVAAARQLNEPVTHAVAAMYLGTACARAGYHAEAIDHLRRALALAERADAVSVLADVHRALGWAWEERGDDERALIHAGQALRLYQATGNAMREADALNSVGWLHARLGRHHRAIAYCERALGLSREHGHRRAEAVTLDSLGYIAQQLGQHARALDLYREALTLARDTDDAYDQASILANLGEVQHRLGHHSDARGAWRQALDLYSAQHRTHDAEDIQRKLDGLLLTR